MFKGIHTNREVCIRNFSFSTWTQDIELIWNKKSNLSTHKSKFTKWSYSRPIQTETVCRWHIKCGREKWAFMRRSIKYCEKRRNAGYHFSFSHNVFKRVLSQGRQQTDFITKGLTPYQATALNFRPVKFKIDHMMN